MLYGTSRTDPMVYAGVIGLVVLVSLAASWLPAGASKLIRWWPSETADSNRRPLLGEWTL
jgi:hypothetical protein